MRERFITQDGKPKKPARVPLEPGFIQKLSDFLTNTSLSHADILKFHSAPASLTPVIFAKIAKGEYRTIRQSHLAFIIGLIESQTTKKTRKRYMPLMEQITDGYLLFLEYEIKRTGVTPAKLLKNALKPQPENLTPAMIGRWRKRSTQKARTAHLRWLLEEYRRHSHAPHLK